MTRFGSPVAAWSISGPAEHIVLIVALLLVVVLAAGVVIQARLLRSRRRIEETLQESEQRFRLLAESAADIVVVYDLNLNARYVSPASLDVLGYAPEELIGTALTELAHPDDIAQIGEELDRLFATGVVVEPVVSRYRHRDGRWVWMEATGRVILDAQGNAESIRVSARDVTTRIEAIEALEEQRRLTNAIITAASDPFLSFDANGYITEWNRAAAEAFGWQRDALIGQQVVPALRLSEDQARLIREVLAGERSLPRRPVESIFRTADNRDIAVEVTAWLVRSGASDSLNCLVRDVTERKEYEQALTEAREQAIAAAELKSQFLATMSHEIRTPMNGVIGLSALLADTELDATQRRYLNGIRSAGDALLVVINDILDFSKLEAGKVDLDDVDFDLRGLVEEVVELMAESAREKGLELIHDIDDDLPGALRGDPGRVRQVLLNLLSNAVKFTERGEVVLQVTGAEAEPPQIEPNQRDPESPATATIRFTVRDTGVGIPPAVQKTLFEPFRQADASTTRRFGGTGLGLAICRQLVDAMRGRLGVSSEDGQGSIFWCELPLRCQGGETRPVGAAESGRAEFAQLAGRRVLVVDDNATSLAVIDRQLRRWRMSSTALGSGAEALVALRDAAGEHRPCEVVIVDMSMPGLHGVDVIRRIRADTSIPPVHTMLLTTGENVDVSAIRAVGVDRWLAKPVRKSRLFEALAEALVGRRPAGRAAADGRPQTTAKRSRGHLLLAEDNEINQQVAVAILTRLGYTVDVAADGRTALELAAERRYDAILMDCLMPKMDGYDATLELRRREHGTRRHMPIIALTASASREDRDRCLTVGMDDHLGKPITPEALDAILDRWIDHGQADGGTPPEAAGR